MTTARISDTTIANNFTGVDNHGTTRTLQDNMIDGNTDNLDGNPLVPLAPL
jgi:hypothetical protein